MPFFKIKKTLIILTKFKVASDTIVPNFYILIILALCSWLVPFIIVYAQNYSISGCLLEVVAEERNALLVQK